MSASQNSVPNTTSAANPFDITDVGLFSTPVMVDIDNDGDLDAFVGVENGNTLFFKNVGNANSAVFAAAVTNPFGIGNVADIMGATVSAEIPQFDSNPTFFDWDNDGDQDLLLGTFPFGNQLYFENIGSATNPVFADPEINPFGLGNVGQFSSPTVVDLDGDGDTDVVIGNYPDGNMVFFENIGGVNQPKFAAPVTNPFGLADVGGFSSPAFGDVDGDGDLDAITGTEAGGLKYFENVGSATAPQFKAATDNPFGLTTVGTYSSPELADIDSDGDLDLFVGTKKGETFFFENIATAGQAPQFAAYSMVEFVDDVATGSEANEFIRGNGRNERISTGDGRNIVNAGGGNDDITGGKGQDTIRAGAGHDLIKGRGGKDLLFGGDGNDTIFGGDGNDTIHGGNGNDRIQGGYGHDSLNGGAGVDTVDYTNWNGGAYYNLETGKVKFYRAYTENVSNFENIETGNGQDYIVGTAGQNHINAGGGNDVLVGGAGADHLTGGQGADRFRFQELDSDIDVITDFSWRQGDRIQIDASRFGASSLGQFDYNYRTGALSFNASPNDGIMPQTFAMISNRPQGFAVHLDVQLV